MAVVKAFVITSLTFTLLETTTGIVSFLTGALSIPPLLGVGTAVDMCVLTGGSAVGLLRALRKIETEPEGNEVVRQES
jgi:hypothetical protein